MTETEYLTAAEAVFDAVARGIDDADADIDCERSGNVLTLEFDSGAKIIVNLQVPMREVWLAAKSGGYHFKFDGKQWRDTRDGGELFDMLSRQVSQEADEKITFKPLRR